MWEMFVLRVLKKPQIFLSKIKKRKASVLLLYEFCVLDLINSHWEGFLFWTQWTEGQLCYYCCLCVFGFCYSN